MRMHRVWKPLDVGGLRLYRVTQSIPNHPDWKREFVVAAKTPTHARELIEAAHKDAMYHEEPYYDGHALNIYMPADWWENGAPTG